jgi:hypothetical protein
MAMTTHRVLKSGGMGVVPFTSGESVGKPQFIKMLRDSGRGERVAGIGFISNAVFEGDEVHLSITEPEGLVLVEPLRFEPPMVEHASNPSAFEFFWRILGFVFELDDPRDFPPLRDPLENDDEGIVRRYISVARRLAESSVMNEAQGFTYHLTDINEIGEVEERFSKVDAQAGLAALLRQCEAHEEPAGFDQVYRVLVAASDDPGDIARDARLARLQSWADARKRLHGRSLNQIMRDKLVRERGYTELDYREPDTPQRLLSAYNYGDLIHWGDKRSVVAEWETDAYSEHEQRLAFLDAATALAHIHIGFAVLAEAALAPRERCDLDILSCSPTLIDLQESGN